VFIMLTCPVANDLEIPGEDFSFGTLFHAQALGDFQALDRHGRRAVFIRLEGDAAAGLRTLRQLFGLRN
jgi:hypothetical protein